MIKEKLEQFQTYNKKIEYLAGVVEASFEALLGLRQAYIDLAKKVHGHFRVVCGECGNVHDLDKDVTSCEKCNSKKVGYGFGDAPTGDTAQTISSNA